jgi:hypothetical protein
MGGFSKSDLVLLTNTIDQDISEYVGPNVELVVSPANNAVAPAIELTCLQLLTPDALTWSATFNEAFRAFFVPGPTLTSWRFVDLTHRTT